MELLDEGRGWGVVRAGGEKSFWHPSRGQVGTAGSNWMAGWESAAGDPVWRVEGCRLCIGCTGRWWCFLLLLFARRLDCFWSPVRLDCLCDLITAEECYSDMLLALSTPGFPTACPALVPVVSCLCRPCRTAQRSTISRSLGGSHSE